MPILYRQENDDDDILEDIKQDNRPTELLKSYIEAHKESSQLLSLFDISNSFMTTIIYDVDNDSYDTRKYPLVDIIDDNFIDNILITFIYKYVKLLSSKIYDIEDDQNIKNQNIEYSINEISIKSYKRQIKDIVKQMLRDFNSSTETNLSKLTISQYVCLLLKNDIDNINMNNYNNLMSKFKDLLYELLDDIF